jgi:hypothetical protein
MEDISVGDTVFLRKRPQCGNNVLQTIVLWSVDFLKVPEHGTIGTTVPLSAALSHPRKGTSVVESQTDCSTSGITTLTYYKILSGNVLYHGIWKIFIHTLENIPQDAVTNAVPFPTDIVSGVLTTVDGLATVGVGEVECSFEIGSRGELEDCQAHKQDGKHPTCGYHSVKIV